MGGTSHVERRIPFILSRKNIPFWDVFGGENIEVPSPVHLLLLQGDTLGKGQRTATLAAHSKMHCCELLAWRFTQLVHWDGGEVVIRPGAARQPHGPNGCPVVAGGQPPTNIVMRA